MDVLNLIGGGKVGGKYPNEEELCCGGCEREIILMVVAKITSLEKDTVAREKATKIAKEHSLDPIWFAKTLQIFASNCRLSLEKGGAVLALFE